jgi:hypothetical protein
MAELKLTGNHLKGSRPVLSFHKVCEREGVAQGACCSHTWAIREARLIMTLDLPSASTLNRRCNNQPCHGAQGVPLCARQHWQSRCSQAFDEQPHLQLLKELFTHMFATPKRHHKSKPFFDHVISFTVADNRIWFRNYQARLRCVST